MHVVVLRVAEKGTKRKKEMEASSSTRTASSRSRGTVARGLRRSAKETRGLPRKRAQANKPELRWGRRRNNANPVADTTPRLPKSLLQRRAKRLACHRGCVGKADYFHSKLDDTRVIHQLPAFCMYLLYRLLRCWWFCCHWCCVPSSLVTFVRYVHRDCIGTFVYLVRT